MGSHFWQGDKPLKQAHKGIPEGCYEEEQGLKGFYGPVSHLVKPEPSTRWVNIEGPLKPHMFDLVKLGSDSKKNKQSDKIKLLYNSDVSISTWKNLKQTSTAIRNADASTLYFCHKGKGVVFTEYGVLSFEKGQYLVMPKCLTHFFSAEVSFELLVVENHTSHFMEPDRGIAGRNALYDAQTLQRPNLEKQRALLKKLDLNITQIEVQHNSEKTVFTYEASVFDTISWKGDLYPFTLGMDDIMPIMSHRSHLPPSAHTTFVAKNFVICSFLPRPLEEDKDALKVPFYHQNIDYDEVLFYHDGDFFSRDNLHAGMMSFHPAGFPHGPHPKAVKGVGNKTHTNEYAVMIDARWPLKMTEYAKQVELADYWQSWKS